MRNRKSQIMGRAKTMDSKRTVIAPVMSGGVAEFPVVPLEVTIRAIGVEQIDETYRG